MFPINFKIIEQYERKYPRLLSEPTLGKTPNKLFWGSGNTIKL